MATATMRSPEARPIKRVLLALNHAGDWTALINRSDTDVLVQAFCNVARHFPALVFIVRPHPTMAHPAHEGVGSLKRIQDHVKALALSNLFVSSVSLEEDLETTDVVMSEYSQVLIDAFRAGKLGLIVNLTGRRSFMTDFEACGFAAVDSERALVEWIHESVSDSGGAAERQACAVECYNAAFRMLMANELPVLARAT
jgi:hypothetical protein